MTTENNCPAGFIPCTVEDHYGALLVTLEDNRTILFQGEEDQKAFLASCYPAGCNEADDVEACPDEYNDIAEKEYTVNVSRSLIKDDKDDEEEFLEDDENFEDIENDDEDDFVEDDYKVIATSETDAIEKGIDAARDHDFNKSSKKYENYQGNIN